MSSVAQHTGVIYMLTNQITDERYVGRTGDFGRRMRKYERGGHGVIGMSITKYGWDNFVVVKIAQGICDAALPACESAFSAIIDPELNLMTSTIGGRMRHLESSKNLMREAKLGKKHSPAHCAKLRVANLGKKHSLETRAKIRVANSGERHPMFGKKQSPETIAKRVETRRANKQAKEKTHQLF